MGKSKNREFLWGKNSCFINKIYWGITWAWTQKRQLLLYSYNLWMKHMILSLFSLKFALFFSVLLFNTQNWVDVTANNICVFYILHFRQEERKTTLGRVWNRQIELKKYEIALIAACPTDVNHHALRAAIWTIVWLMHCGMVCDLNFSQACLKIFSVFLSLGVTLKKLPDSTWYLLTFGHLNNPALKERDAKWTMWKMVLEACNVLE